MKTLFVCIVLCILLSGQAFACSCFEPTISDAFKWADVVFSGEATKVQYVDDVGVGMFGERRIIVTFQVSTFWKGDVGETITLHTVYNRISCGGYFFKQGEKFIVYAKKERAEEWLGDGDFRPVLQGVGYPKPYFDILDTGLCTRTHRLADADVTGDLKELERLKKVPAK